jgi:uncharacterized membrane protein (UPF0182 family)
MISWMAARCDFPEYGKMLFYQLPKEKLIYGPMQIEAMIDQNTLISQQLTLWDQKGSSVIRGNLIAVPIENSFLYVVPVYLTAAGTNFPQLKRVIVISGDKVAMEPTLDEAIQSVFGALQPQKGAPARSGPPELGQARAQFDEAQKAMQQGGLGKIRRDDGGAQALAGWAGTVGLHNPGNPYANPGILSGWDLSRRCRVKGPDEPDRVAYEFACAKL